MAAHPKPQRVVDETFREWIRGKPCVALGEGCMGPVDACHIKSRGAGGSDPNNLFPACRRHHTQQHALGIKSFQVLYQLDLFGIAKWLYQSFKEGK